MKKVTMKVLVAPSDKKIFETAAEQCGLSLSSWARAILLSNAIPAMLQSRKNNAPDEARTIRSPEDSEK